MKIDRSFTFGRTTKKKLDSYLSGSPKWKEFCKGREVIKEFISSFDNEENQVALEYWYNHYVYSDNPNCWSRKSPSIVIGKIIRKRSLETMRVLNIETGETGRISRELFYSRRDIYFAKTSKVYKDWKKNH